MFHKIIKDDVLNLFASNCPHITSLTLKGPFLVTDNAFSNIFKALGASLEYIHLENAAKFSESSIETLSLYCPNLHHIVFSLCSSLGDSGVSCISKLKHIKKLHLAELGAIADNTVIDLLCTIGKNLTSLSLEGFIDMTDKVLIEGIAPNCINLSHLSLKSNECITDEAMIAMINTLTLNSPLRGLILSRVVNLKDDSINSIISHHGPSLTHLNINGLDDLTILSLKTLVSGNCPNLEDVDLSWIRNVDDEIFSELIKLPFLKCVRIYGCNKLTECMLSKRHFNANNEIIKIMGNEFD